jgi:hypothetical protein
MKVLERVDELKTIKIKNKKGIMAFNFLAMIPRIIFLVIMLIVCVILINMFLNNKFDILDVQSEVVINGLIYSPGGIGYTDPLTGRVYPEIVDLEQLDSARLDSAFYYPDNRMLTARVAIEKNIKPGETLKIVYLNKEWYDNWKPLLALKHLPGIGGVTDNNKVLPIIIRDESGELKMAYVYFRVIQPKSLSKRE